MSHKIIYMGIPAKTINGDTSKQHIDAIVEKVMSKYVYNENALQKGTEKLDWYVIGGRWEGWFATLKSAPSAYKTESGLFAYENMDDYNAFCNNGKNGPYIAGTEEFIPVNGACKKDIEISALSKLESYKHYVLMLMALNNDARLDGLLPDDIIEITEDALYTKGEDHLLLLKRGESYEAWSERRGMSKSEFPKQDLGFDSDAYIDLNGIWHDVNDVWAKWEVKAGSEYKAGKAETMSKIFSSGNPEEAAQKELWAEVNSFIESLADDDYLLVIDGHI